LTSIFDLDNLNGMGWLMPIARCLLQAVNYLHLNNYVHQDIHAGNIFTAFVKDEMVPQDGPGVLKFKLGDLGVARLASEADATNTRPQWMLPPEVLNPNEYGKIDRRLDIYHVGLILLQLATSKQRNFTTQEILDGVPRELALTLPAPYSFALEKALRRHVHVRTDTASELWRDLNSPGTE
jgi:serine/threonine-protein kinase